MPYTIRPLLRSIIRGYLRSLHIVGGRSGYKWVRLCSRLLRIARCLVPLNLSSIKRLAPSRQFRAAAVPHMGEDSSPRWLVASDSTFHQTESPVPSVPRGGCPAYGKRQLAALAGRLYRYMVQSFRPGISARSTSSALVCAPFRPRP